MCYDQYFVTFKIQYWIEVLQFQTGVGGLELNKDLVDMAIAHLTTDTVVKEFLKKLTYYQIEQNKRLAEIRLKDLQLLK